MLPLVFDPDVVHEEETRLLAELLAGWSEKYPDVQVPDRWRGLVPAMRCWWRPAGPSCW